MGTDTGLGEGGRSCREGGGRSSVEGVGGASVKGVGGAPQRGVGGAPRRGWEELRGGVSQHRVLVVCAALPSRSLLSLAFLHLKGYIVLSVLFTRV